MRRISPYALALITACSSGAQPGMDAAPRPAMPAVVRYQPASLQYRGLQHQHVEQEFSGQVTANDQVTRLYLTTEITGTAGDLSAIFVIDSVSVQGSPQFSPAQIEGTWGTRFTAKLMANGELADFTGGDTAQPFVAQLQTSLETFFPRIPAGGVGPGQTWADTVTTTLNPGAGIVLDMETISNHESLAWTEHGGVVALHIRTLATYTLSGSGEQGGQQFTLDGRGRSYVDKYLSRDGQYLGAVSADTAEIEVFLDAMGLVIPVTQRSIDTLTVVR